MEEQRFERGALAVRPPSERVKEEGLDREEEMNGKVVQPMRESVVGVERFVQQEEDEPVRNAHRNEERGCRCFNVGRGDDPSPSREPDTKGVHRELRNRNVSV